MFKKIIAASLASLLLSMQFVPVFAQEQQKLPTATPVDPSKQDQVETVRVGTAVVQVDAVVTDKSGRRVTGLTAADFQVMDEGATQNVDFFSAIEGSRALRTTNGAAAASTSTPAPATPAAPVSSLAMPYQGRHIALVFDDLNLSNDNFLRSRRAFADYINNNLTQNDMVALISTGGALASMQQFTSDKERLLTALNRIAAQPRANDNNQQPVTMTDDEAIRIDSGDNNALKNVTSRSAVVDAGPTGTFADPAVGGLPAPNVSTRGNDVGTDPNEARIRTAARARVAQIGNKARANLSTLNSLFRGMANLPGRKIVILMTESFMTAGGTSEDISNQLTQLIETARRAGVSVYALDAVGLRTENTNASERISGTELAFRNANPNLTMSSSEKLGGARALAYGTGGEMIANTNSLIAGLQKAIDDSSSYYVVGFKPTQLDNKFHRLTVTIKGKPELIVRTRKGYLAANEETIKGTEGELLRALKSPVPLMDLPVEMVANVVPSAGGFVVVTGLHVGRNYLSLPAATAADQTASYEVVSYVFGAGRDQAVGAAVKNLTFDLAKDPAMRQKLKTEGLVYVPQPFNFEPGIYQMRAVIREKTSGAVGSAYQFFEVPDIKDRKNVLMSSLVMMPSGQSAFNGMNSFKPGSDVDIRYVIFNLPKETAGWTQRVKLMDATGKQLFDMELAPAQPTGADKSQASQGTSFNLPPTRGRYSLVVTLKDGKGKVNLERRADFVIE
ncbi:MAG TPA: VWA domain-containing protein [Pyrinomonadaceae bacterium]|jgi:VWFA-related protein